MAWPMNILKADTDKLTSAIMQQQVAIAGIAQDLYMMLENMKKIQDDFANVMLEMAKKDGIDFDDKFDVQKD